MGKPEMCIFARGFSHARTFFWENVEIKSADIELWYLILNFNQLKNKWNRPIIFYNVFENLKCCLPCINRLKQFIFDK